MSAGITAMQYYNYKAATSSMSKKAEKLEVIAAMDLTSEQKDALYYSEGWESKSRPCPGRSAGVSMPVLGGSGVTMPVLRSRELWRTDACAGRRHGEMLLNDKAGELRPPALHFKQLPRTGIRTTEQRGTPVNVA